MDDDNIAGALFLDLSKAFDMIDHELLLKKMQLKFGVMGRAEKLFQTYLNGTCQSVPVEQATSSWQTPIYGVHPRTTDVCAIHERPSAGCQV